MTHMEMIIRGPPTSGGKEKEEPMNEIINVLLGNWIQY